jgi:glutamate racemase
MIGIFDSGLGGLTVFKHVRALLPEAGVLYLADQAHVPYGERSPDELQSLLAANLRFLEEAGVHAVAAGCNTSCAIARRFGWPRTRVPVFDIIAAAAESAALSGMRHFGVVATSATVRSGAYGDAIRTLVPDAIVVEVSAPALVPLVESGRSESREAYAAVRAALAQFTEMPQAVIYGCTHYPLLDAAFAAILDRGVIRLDPARAQADRVVASLMAHGREAGGGASFRTTGDAAAFREQLKVFAGKDGEYEDVERVELRGIKLAECAEPV